MPWWGVTWTLVRGRNCEQRGIDADGFAARQLTAALLDDVDLVVAAAREHRAVAARLHPAALARTVTLRDLADLLSKLPAAELAACSGEATWVRQVAAAAFGRRGSVPARQDGVDLVDPIGGPPALFEQMAHQADDALAPVVRALREASQSDTG